MRRVLARFVHFRLPKGCLFVGLSPSKPKGAKSFLPHTWCDLSLASSLKHWQPFLGNQKFSLLWMITSDFPGFFTRVGLTEAETGAVPRWATASEELWRETTPKLIVGRRFRSIQRCFGRQRLAQERGKSGGSHISKAWIKSRI